jgi:hypothetical protein
MNTTRVLDVATTVDAGPRSSAAARGVSAVLVTLMAAAAVFGLTTSVYRDAGEMVALLRGYDLVALVVVVPVLVAALLRRTARSLLLWAGLLVYAGYNYAYYLFGTRLNALFVLHAAVVGLAVVGLVLLLATIDVRAIRDRYGRRGPVRSVAGVLLVLGISLAGMWLINLAGALLGGGALDEPSQLVVPAAFTQLGAALDLALLVPGYLLAAVLLWRRAAWGYVAATAVLVAGVLQQIAYMTALVFQVAEPVAGAVAFDPVEPFIAGAFAAAAATMLWHCRGHGGAR